MLTVSLTLLALLATTAGPASGAWDGRHSIWRQGAFVTQYTDFSCVGATIQIMLNLIDRSADHSRKNQFGYLDFAKEESKYPVTDLGADPQGWANALIRFGAGDDYGWTTALTMQGSLRTAARQMRETNKPVGLLVHRGRHAWVMTGFEATADPATTDEFDVTAAEVVGPLWPHGTLNGRPFDPGPQTWMTTEVLSRKFDPYAEPNQALWSGRWVTIVPRVSEAANEIPQRPPAELLPDLNSAFGWMWVFNRLAVQSATRDLLWLP